MPMNGVLSERTWGTWDALYSAPPASNGISASPPESLDASAAAVVSRERSKKKLERRGLAAPKASQLWFEEVLARIEGDAFGRTHCAYRCNPLRCLHGAQGRDHGVHDEREVIPWAALPQGIHPRDGKLPEARVRRKRQQVENLAVFLQRMLRPGDKVVEFCAGSGYVALPLACMFPQCTFVVLDKKEPSLAIAKERVAAAQLSNVELFCGFIDEYDAPFDVGIALHACGEATDMALEKCLVARAAFVLAPCCVGKIKLSALTYPRSAALRRELSRAEYEVLARAADFGHSSDAAVSATPVNRRRRQCKSLLESDRNARARERGYETFMFVMHPNNATPKNDVLVGLPPAKDDEEEEARRVLRLECARALRDDERDRVIFESGA